MPLEDLIGELQNTNSYDWPTLRLWFKRFTALSSANESIVLDQFLIIYRKIKDIVGLNVSPLSPLDPPPPEFLPSPQVKAREISTQQAISALLAMPLNLDKNDEDKLTIFLNAEYTALSDHLLLDISSLDQTKKNGYKKLYMKFIYNIF